jgi:hypothetical protein
MDSKKRWDDVDQEEKLTRTSLMAAEAESARTMALIELVAQLIRINGHLEALTEATNRIADQ